jgi:predicted nuclease of predicted toxin-antitoxin system
MKFLCDVHISFKLAKAIRDLGHDCIHVNSILDKWYTKDEAIAKYSDENNYTLITKDADFRDSFFVKKTPKKLIKINLGNVSNEALIMIFEKNILKIEKIINDNKNIIIEIDSDIIRFLAV